MIFLALTPAGLATARRAQAALGGEVNAKLELCNRPGRGSSSPGTGEAESARSAEPGEGSRAELCSCDPHPVASRLDLSRPGRGIGRGSSGAPR